MRLYPFALRMVGPFEHTIKIIHRPSQGEVSAVWWHGPICKIAAAEYFPLHQFHHAVDVRQGMHSGHFFWAPCQPLPVRHIGFTRL